MALMLALARHVPQANATMRAGEWKRSTFIGVEMRGKTLGIIGCGNIGSVVADRAQGLKMKAIAYDPFLSEERADDLGVEKVELAALFKRADFISLHTPLLPETRHLVNSESLALMKPDAVLVNTAIAQAQDPALMGSAFKAGVEAGRNAYLAGRIIVRREAIASSPVTDVPNPATTTS